jgi:hypothetical protein
MLTPSKRDWSPFVGKASVLELDPLLHKFIKIGLLGPLPFPIETIDPGLVGRNSI